MQRKEVECWAQKCEHLSVSLKSLRIPKEVPASGSLKQKDNLESWTAVCIYTDGWTPPSSFLVFSDAHRWILHAACSGGVLAELLRAQALPPPPHTPPMLGLPAFVLLRVI